MKNLVIYNDSQYFYYISKIIYNMFKPYFQSNDSMKIIYYEYLGETNNNYLFLDDELYLLFVPPKKLFSMPKNYIVYNFEQFTTDKQWSSHYIDFLKNAIYVIDYSIKNIIKFEDYNINTYYLPHTPNGSYRHKNLDNINKDIDVLFIGNMNKRRSKWLNKLVVSHKDYKLKIVNKTFFEESIEYLARSKIVVNIHYYEGDTILEVSRIIPALENNCLVISEKSDDDIYNIIYKDIIDISEEDELNNNIEKTLNDYDNKLNKMKNNLKNISFQIIANNIIDLIDIIKKI